MTDIKIKDKIIQGRTFLGIELGSTRIKAVLIDDTFTPIAEGSHAWENRFENGYWTYSLDDIHNAVQSCYASLAENVQNKYGLPLTTLGGMGISAMMHGYMAFDENDNLLVPFRTWRNTTTKTAADCLTKLLKFNIPQRWSVAHLCQAIIDKEEHVQRICKVSTLAVYIHYLLTDRFEAGIGEASGMFPVRGNDYDEDCLTLADQKLEALGLNKKLRSIFPDVRLAGQKGAFLTQKGAAFLDKSGQLKAGVPICPPEGDAGTGMTATNSVLPLTGNVSAGTSIFAMLVMDKPMNGYYPEIDVVATPDGAPAAMVHCNNCCGELDMWVNMFGEFAALCNADTDKSKLYEILYTNALNAAPDCGGAAAYNYISGEPVTGLSSGSPMYFRRGERPLSLGEFFRTQLYSSMAALKIGMDMLFEKESVTASKFTGHGGLFKVKGAAQQILADGLDTDVSLMQTAGEGGAWGMALLAAYMVCGSGEKLSEFLDRKVFADMPSFSLSPTKEGKRGFDSFIEVYKKGLAAQKAAAEIQMTEE